MCILPKRKACVVGNVICVTWTRDKFVHVVHLHRRYCQDAEKFKPTKDFIILLIAYVYEVETRNVEVLVWEALHVQRVKPSMSFHTRYDVLFMEALGVMRSVIHVACSVMYTLHRVQGGVTSPKMWQS
jgi:hypothetical protein